MNPVKITDNIYWVGGIDWNLRDFHGYSTERGSTYNSYLIIDEKIALIDTAKYYLVDEMISRISKIVDPSKIDYLIANHVEMDHSGGLLTMKEIAPNAAIITSPMGEKGLNQHYKKNWLYDVKKTGDVVKLGKRSLLFILENMVHWPDNMACFCPEEKILFSQDAFGQHIASYQRFDCEYNLGVQLEEAKKYYANIVMPYGTQVQKVLAEAQKIDIKMICPSHGLVWKDHIPEILKEYAKWAENETNEEALIIYDTMWNSTEKMAYAIADVFDDHKIPYTLFDLKKNHISNIITRVMTAKYICIGSPTLNSGMLPSLGAFMTYFKGLSPKNRIGFAFGSYGWGGQSISDIYKILNDMGFEVWPMYKVNYIPDCDQIEDLKKTVATHLKSIS